VARIREAAFLGRYGHQDMFRVLGRDPRKRPLTALERAIYCECLREFWEKEIERTPEEPENEVD